MTDFSPQAPPVVHVTNIGCKSTEAKSEKKSLKENFKSRRIRHQKKAAIIMLVQLSRHLHNTKLCNLTSPSQKRHLHNTKLSEEAAACVFQNHLLPINNLPLRKFGFCHFCAFHFVVKLYIVVQCNHH